MKKPRFEHKITALYLILGAIWILFSDMLLEFFIQDINSIMKLQTLKGVFYVIITALFFYLFIRKHLTKLRNTEQELEAHKNNLLQMVQEKTKDLDAAIEALSEINAELNRKNTLINNKNDELSKTLKTLKETQFQLIQFEKMASIGVLTAGISHEINNPLNYIMGGLTGLENYIKEAKIESEKVDFFINSIKSGIERATTIMSGLNQMSRNNERYDEICDIHAIIDNCLSITKGHLKERIDIDKKYFTQPVIVKGNSGKLHQVFINLIINGCQAIESKGTILISTKKADDKVHIIVKDSGCGISGENLSKITDPFFTTKDPGKGTGLGLSIVYNIIHSHNGTIEFESTLDKGTAAIIVLPVKNKQNGKS
jgi:signal transduction histidine kinase